MAKIQINQQQTSIGIGEGMLSYPSQGTPGPSGTSVLIGNAAQGLASLGSATMKYAEQQQERKNISETTKAQVNFLTQLDNINTNYLSNTQFSDFDSYTNGAKQQFNDLLNDTAQGITNSRAREDFINRMRLGKEAQYMSGIAEYGRKLNEKSYKESSQQDINGMYALAQNPNSLTSLEELRESLTETAYKYADSHNIDKDSDIVKSYIKEHDLGLIVANSYAQIAKDPYTFKAKLLGDYNSFINRQSENWKKKHTKEGKLDAADPEVLQEFFASEYAPAFAKELEGDMRQKLLDAPDIEIKKLEAEAKKLQKEAVEYQKYLFGEEQRVNSLSIKETGHPVEKGYIPTVYGLTEDGKVFSAKKGESIDLTNYADNYLPSIEQELGMNFTIVEGGRGRNHPGSKHDINQPGGARAADVSMSEHSPEKRLAFFQKELNNPLVERIGTSDPIILAKYKNHPKLVNERNHIDHAHITLKRGGFEKYVKFTSAVQEKAFKIGYADGGVGKALTELDKQRKSELEDTLVHTVSTDIKPLLSSTELLTGKKQFNDAVAAMPASPEKLLLLEKKKVLDKAIDAKVAELKTDPAAYADKYGNTGNAKDITQKIANRVRFQRTRLGIPDGAVKPLTKQEVFMYATNIAKQESAEARIAYITDLEKKVGTENYRTAIAQIASEDSSLDKPYWVIPQLSKTSTTAAQALTRALKNWDNKTLDTALEAKKIDKDLLITDIYTAMGSLLSNNMRELDPKAYQMFSDTAIYLGKYYAATLNTTDRKIIANQVKKDLLENSYSVLDLGPGNAEDILISKDLLKDNTFNLNALKRTLQFYIDTPFSKENIALVDDYIVNDLAIGKEAYDKSRERYTMDFITRLNNNLDLVPTISGLGAYVVYINPNTKQKLPLKNKKGNLIYINFEELMPYANDLEEARLTQTGLTGEMDKARKKLRQEIQNMRTK